MAYDQFTGGIILPLRHPGLVFLASRFLDRGEGRGDVLERPLLRPDAEDELGDGCPYHEGRRDANPNRRSDRSPVPMSRPKMMGPVMPPSPVAIA